MAVADVPDDLFIEELERLRRMGLRAGDIHGIQKSSSANYAIKDSSDRLLDTKRMERMSTQAVLVQEIGVEDEMDWLRARRAILCCMDLVRTERSYQERLQELADSNVSTRVPES